MAAHPAPFSRDSLPETDTARHTNFFLSSQVRIEAPAEHVFRVLRDTGTWKDWNTFCPEVIVEHTDHQHKTNPSDATHIDRDVTMAWQIRMTPDSNLRPQKILVTSCTSTPEESYSIGWQGLGIPRMLLKSDRMSEVTPFKGQQACQFRTWEGMSGPLSPVVKVIYGQILQDRFNDWAGDLKGYAEKTWNDEGEGR